MEKLWPLVIWLGISSVYLLDTYLITVMMGGNARPAVRQEWLAAPLCFTLIALLFTPWAPWVALALASALALHLALHIRAMRRMEAVLRRAPAEWVERVGQLAARWGTPRPDRLLIDPADRLQPAVLGLWRQSLILPRSVLGSQAGEAEAVVAHELAHVAARDPLKLWLLRQTRLLLGWHPVARQMADTLALEVEMEADRKATAWLGDAESYALLLGRWGLRQQSPVTPFGATLTSTSSHLLLRLKSLLNPTAPPAHLAIPTWVPGGEGRRARRVTGALRWIHLMLSAGYLALFLFLLRLV